MRMGKTMRDAWRNTCSDSIVWKVGRYKGNKRHSPTGDGLAKTYTPLTKMHSTLWKRFNEESRFLESVTSVVTTACPPLEMGNKQLFPAHIKHRCLPNHKFALETGHSHASCLCCYFSQMLAADSWLYYCRKKKSLRKQAKNKCDPFQLNNDKCEHLFQMSHKTGSQGVGIVQPHTSQHPLQSMGHSKCSEMCDEWISVKCVRLKDFKRYIKQSCKAVTLQSCLRKN